MVENIGCFFTANITRFTKNEFYSHTCALYCVCDGVTFWFNWSIVIFELTHSSYSVQLYQTTRDMRSALNDYTNTKYQLIMSMNQEYMWAYTDPIFLVLISLVYCLLFVCLLFFTGCGSTTGLRVQNTYTSLVRQLSVYCLVEQKLGPTRKQSGTPVFFFKSRLTTQGGSSRFHWSYSDRKYVN